LFQLIPSTKFPRRKQGTVRKVARWGVVIEKTEDTRPGTTPRNAGNDLVGERAIEEKSSCKTGGENLRKRKTALVTKFTAPNKQACFLEGRTGWGRKR